MTRTLPSVERAIALITKACAQLPEERVALARASGRVLARDLAARRDQPPGAVSAMDGYALRAEDARKTDVFKMIGESVAGRGFSGRVGPCQTVRIHTGAPVPQGADTIVIQEVCTADARNRVRINKGTSPRVSDYIRPRGFDFHKGAILLHKGTRLTPAQTGLAASMNHPTLPVIRAPRIGILSCGDELVQPGTRPKKDQIISANSHALLGFFERAGADVDDLGIARDSMSAFAQKLKRADAYDLLVSSGGVSVGGRDITRDALEARGFDILVHGVAVRPGKPFLFGRMGGKSRTLVAGLPGNPVSALVCAYVFLRPLLAALSGARAAPGASFVRLGASLPANDERQDYLRARLVGKKTGETAMPLSRQDSAQMSALAESDALIIRRPHAKPAKPGALIEIMRL